MEVDVHVLGDGGSLGGLGGRVDDACVTVVCDEIEVFAVGLVD